MIEQAEASAGKLPPLRDYHQAEAASRGSLSWLRRRVLELLWRSRKPWGVYDIANRISEEGRKTHPNSVYRSIKSLAAAGLIIPIVSRSRYIISPDPEAGCWAVMLCSRCSNFSVVPMAAEGQELWSVARGFGFRPDRANIECIGLCRACATGTRSDE